MTIDDAHRFFEDALARAASSGDSARLAELREVLESLHEELADDPAALIQVRALLDRLQDPHLAVAPASWVRAALARIRELETVARPGLVDLAKDALRSTARVIEAHLVGDTFAGQALQGIRGSSAHQARQLHFASELGDVHIQVDRSDPDHSLLGQFVPARTGLLEAPARARVRTETGETFADLDASGQFHFKDVDSGEVRIDLDLGKESLRLAPFRIESRQEE